MQKHVTHTPVLPKRLLHHSNALFSQTLLQSPPFVEPLPL